MPSRRSGSTDRMLGWITTEESGVETLLNGLYSNSGDGEVAAGDRSRRSWIGEWSAARRDTDGWGGGEHDGSGEGEAGLLLARSWRNLRFGNFVSIHIIIGAGTTHRNTSLPRSFGCSASPLALRLCEALAA